MIELYKPRQPQVNWNNRLTNSLVFDAGLHEQNNTTTRDLVNKRSTTTTGSPLFQTTIHPNGVRNTDIHTAGTKSTLEFLHKMKIFSLVLDNGAS